ncbi:hypothetical protein [Alistipes sp.]|uniref:hypothetical protein n=1 Tax=Alistipes sp. TaxID=1872444 RepID=UPI0025C63D78|nr:hypothetical protein [Alistipes sp.]MCI7141243.1 hypothetical protein [Alistipes sp.]MDY5397136.1 hypothetical protein [Alistipes sp.]
MKKVISLILLIVGAVLTGCSGQPRIRAEVTYPEMISPIYYLDTFQIHKPLVVYIDSEPYITSEEVFNRVADKTTLPKTHGVARYFTPMLNDYRSWGYIAAYEEPRFFNKSLSNLWYQNDFLYFERNLKLLDSVQGVAVYRFDREPQNFLLSLIATEVYEDTLGDVIYGVEYSNDYMLAIFPLFSRKDREAIYYKCYYLSGDHWI